MKDSKLIKVFKKQSLVKKALIRVSLGVTFVAGALILLEDLSTQAISGLPVLVTAVSLFTYNFQSTIQVYERYMICHNPFFFWKYKKLFYFHKIDYISIYKVSSDIVYGLRIHLLEGQEYAYRIDMDEAQELIDILKAHRVRVSVDIHNYQTSFTR